MIDAVGEDDTSFKAHVLAGGQSFDSRCAHQIAVSGPHSGPYEGFAKQ
jgi:hypothetical protein